MYTVDHTLSYRSQNLIHACAKLIAHVHSTKIGGGNFKQFKTSVRLSKVMDNSPLTRKIINIYQTEVFHQMRVTTGDTACSVKGYYVFKIVWPLDIANVIKIDTHTR